MIIFFGREFRLVVELEIKLVKIRFERDFCVFFHQRLPEMAQEVRFIGEAQFLKMIFDGVAVNVKPFGGIADVAVVNDEPIEKIMKFHIFG